MAKSKYDPATFPLLAEGYARKGLTDKQIAERLGIGISIYYQYQNRYPEFALALKKGKKPIDVEVENALLKRALGYECEDVITEFERDKGGEPTPKRMRRVKKHIPGDVAAQIFWLKNRQPETWREKQTIQVDYEKLSDDDLAKLITGIVQPNTQPNEKN